jgi:MoaA/NifB/PqqE/SkfB family radical SAM enzyme
LDVVEHISRHKGALTAVITSGWFLEETNFMAASVRYKNDLEYLRVLKERGLTHVIFSVDGPEEVHDYWRQFPGLYQRILRGIPKVREAGLEPKVSVVLSDAIDQRELSMCHLALANALYAFEKDIPERDRIQFLLADDMNYVSNFIDIGNGVDMGEKKSFRYEEMPDNLLRCKNFFRPFPSLRIQANGELSLCPLIDAGEGYGNVSEQGFLHVLNHLQDAFTYKLHAENQIVDYRKYLDLSLFGPNVGHICSLRTVLTLLAKEIESSGIDPEKDLETLRRLNLEVASRSGFLPASGKTATGVKRPV